jgi:hypothetical protein
VRFEEHRRHPGSPGGIAHRSLDLPPTGIEPTRVTDLSARTAVPSGDVLIGRAAAARRAMGARRS